MLLYSALSGCQRLFQNCTLMHVYMCEGGLMSSTLNAFIVHVPYPVKPQSSCRCMASLTLYMHTNLPWSNYSWSSTAKVDQLLLVIQTFGSIFFFQFCLFLFVYFVPKIVYLCVRGCNHIFFVLLKMFYLEAKQQLFVLSFLSTEPNQTNFKFTSFLQCKELSVLLKYPYALIRMKLLITN